MAKGKIAQYLAIKNLKSRDLYTAIRVSRQTWYKILHGETLPKLDEFCIIKERLKAAGIEIEAADFVKNWKKTRNP